MSAVQPTLTDPQPDALEVGPTATKAVKGRSRIPWRFLGSRALFGLLPRQARQNRRLIYCCRRFLVDSLSVEEFRRSRLGMTPSKGFLY